MSGMWCAALVLRVSISNRIRRRVSNACAITAPPSGIFHRSMLLQLGDWLAEKLSSSAPDLLLAGKLSVEGIAVAHAARKLGIPYAVCVQGNTDLRVLRARPDLTHALRRIWHDAAAVFPFAPWAMSELEQRLGKRAREPQMLPCATALDTPIAPTPGGKGLLSVFHLRNHREKNLTGLASAMKLLSQQMHGASLSIIGGGSAADQAACKAIAGDRPDVTFEGDMDHHALPARLNQGAALVMPSLRESFGMVFIEALFAGLPIIYPKGRAVDGYFDDCPFAIPVDPRKPQEIANAMRFALINEAEMKTALADWQSSDHAQQFTRPAIRNTFVEGLRSALQ